MRAGNDKIRGGPAPAEIGIVLYPGAQLAAVHGLTDLFLIADRAARSAGWPCLRVSHWQLDDAGGAMGRVFDSDGAAPPGPCPTCLVLPPTLVALPAPEVTAAIAVWLKGRYEAGAILASVCSGAFLLAETGLLAGRAASTHWSCAEALAVRFPGVEIDTAARLIDHGDLATAGGFMAWVDLGLHLAGRLLGAAVAAETARFLLVDPSSQAGPGRFAPILSHGDRAILRAQHWLHVRDARDVSLAALAAEARLEKRTFLRRFVRATGMAPLEYCRRVRVARATEMLEAGGRSTHEIAWAVGYADPGAFARAFRRVTGMPPGAYRRAAQGRPAPAASG